MLKNFEYDYVRHYKGLKDKGKIDEELIPVKTDEKILHALERIAQTLEDRADPARHRAVDLNQASAFIWHAEERRLIPVGNTGALPAAMLVGIEDHLETLRQNTAQFAKGFAANNVLLWGSRGTGKSSAVKSIHAELASDHALILIEIHREDIGTLSILLDILRDNPDKRFILFCDDLSFDEEDSSYKSLKAVLEGGISPKPEHVVFYATSNRRHLIPRNMIENESRTAIHGGESMEEKVSLSDRFGLWLGFYPCDQDQFFAMVENYAARYDLPLSPDELRAQALEWSMTRGSRSGRVAWQFIRHLAGLHGKAL